jgi:heme/copper-type cytochrome/quinol oxidase subunit 3
MHSDYTTDPYFPGSARNASTEYAEPQKHSGLGIASFVMSVIAGIITFGLIVAATVVEMSSPDGMDEESMEAVLLGLSLIATLFVLLVSLGLGICGLFQSGKKVFAILGVVFSACILFGTLGLMLIGMRVQ